MSFASFMKEKKRKVTCRLLENERNINFVLKRKKHQLFLQLNGPPIRNLMAQKSL